MFITSKEAITIFQQSVNAWHAMHEPAVNPFGENTINYLLFKKNQIDTIQWHLEDEIRRQDLDKEHFISIKRSIDKLNQQRTDLVEAIDDQFMEAFKAHTVGEAARLQSESPAWMLDRMSILELKVFHMREQTERQDAPAEHRALTQSKLEVLLEQRTDLGFCFDNFLEERCLGNAYFKLYRQMKMYNDVNLNPALYQNAPKH